MVVMNSSNTGKDKNKTEHPYCGTDDCCQMCETAVGDTPPREALQQLAKDVMAKHKK